MCVVDRKMVESSTIFEIYSEKYEAFDAQVLVDLTVHSKGFDRLCGLVLRVPGYRSRCPGFGSCRYQNFWEVVGLERGPLSLVRIIEELLDRTVAAPV
jgi:hypothetical protein